MILLTRDEFRESVLVRDNYKCIVCGKPAKDAHHILERRLFQDGGYYLDNGASLCGKCHIEAEQTILSAQTLREILCVDPILPEHLYRDQMYDKWGNIIIEGGNGSRLPGELFDDESVQKILSPVLHLFVKYIKYPRTYHLPWSNLGKSDRMLKDDTCFIGNEVVVTEKLDGENTTLYNGYLHARSLEYEPHESRNFIKQFHAKIGHEIPENMRICCENVSAVHSITYKYLNHFVYGFSIWDGLKCLSWDETIEWFDLLSIPPVPVLYHGTYDKYLIHSIYENISNAREIEGYVIRRANSFHMKDFSKNIAKFVRPNHVQDTVHHWKSKKVIFNNFDRNILK